MLATLLATMLLTFAFGNSDTMQDASILTSKIIQNPLAQQQQQADSSVARLHDLQQTSNEQTIDSLTQQQQQQQQQQVQLQLQQQATNNQASSNTNQQQAFDATSSSKLQLSTQASNTQDNNASSTRLLMLKQLTGFSANTPPLFVTSTRDFYIDADDSSFEFSTKINAVDEEGDTLSYSLVSSTVCDVSAYFSIDETSGVLELSNFSALIADHSIATTSGLQQQQQQQQQQAERIEQQQQVNEGEVSQKQKQSDDNSDLSTCKFYVLNVAASDGQVTSSVTLHFHIVNANQQRSATLASNTKDAKARAKQLQLNRLAAADAMLRKKTAEFIGSLYDSAASAQQQQQPGVELPINVNPPIESISVLPAELLQPQAELSELENANSARTERVFNQSQVKTKLNRQQQQALSNKQQTIESLLNSPRSYQPAPASVIMPNSLRALPNSLIGSSSSSSSSSLIGVNNGGEQALSRQQIFHQQQQFTVFVIFVCVVLICLFVVVPLYVWHFQTQRRFRALAHEQLARRMSIESSTVRSSSAASSSMSVARKTNSSHDCGSTAYTLSSLATAGGANTAAAAAAANGHHQTAQQHLLHLAASGKLHPMVSLHPSSSAYNISTSNYTTSIGEDNALFTSSSTTDYDTNQRRQHRLQSPTNLHLNAMNPLYVEQHNQHNQQHFQQHVLLRSKRINDNSNNKQQQQSELQRRIDCARSNNNAARNNSTANSSLVYDVNIYDNVSDNEFENVYTSVQNLSQFRPTSPTLSTTSESSTRSLTRFLSLPAPTTTTAAATAQHNISATTRKAPPIPERKTLSKSMSNSKADDICAFQLQQAKGVVTSNEHFSSKTLGHNQSQAITSLTSNKQLIDLKRRKSIASRNAKHQQQLLDNDKSSDSNVNKWEIPRWQLTGMRILGEGQFGQVWLYKLNSSDATTTTTTTTISRNNDSNNNGSSSSKSQLVAVKMLKKSSVNDKREQQDLLAEIEIMKLVCKHPNVVKLLHCCTIERSKPIYLVMEYVKLGKLQAYLRDRRPSKRVSVSTHAKKAATAAVAGGNNAYKFSESCEEEEDDVYETTLNCNKNISIDNVADEDSHSSTPTSSELIKFMYHVAKGMDYVSSQGIVHRDLASRNILISDQKVCKVADFGMARLVATPQQQQDTNNDTSDSSNNNELASYARSSSSSLKIPYRWMAPEVWNENKYSTKSDVFSFAILMWEIVTLGSTPYEHLKPDKVIANVALRGLRLEKPHYCHDELFDIITLAWAQDARQRPSFNQLAEKLEALMARANDYLELDQYPQQNYYNIPKTVASYELC